MGILPQRSADGMDLMSINLLLEEEDQPVIWRGPVLSGVVKQFWTDVLWGDLDVLFIDMPPGTGDVPLTVFQSIPVDGIIVVTSPQELVGMIVKKATNMARMMDIPILGLVENMSYLACPIRSRPPRRRASRCLPSCPSIRIRPGWPIPDALARPRWRISLAWRWMPPRRC